MGAENIVITGGKDIVFSHLCILNPSNWASCALNTETNLFFTRNGLIAFNPKTYEHPLVELSLNVVVSASKSCSQGSAQTISHNTPCLGISTNLFNFSIAENLKLNKLMFLNLQNPYLVIFRHVHKQIYYLQYKL